MHTPAPAVRVVLAAALFTGGLGSEIDFLKYYETFNSQLLQNSDSGQRVRRSGVWLPGHKHNSSTYSYKFTRLNHQFEVILDRKDLFSDRPVLSLYEGSRRRRVQLPLDTDRFFQGKLAGKNFS